MFEKEAEEIANKRCHEIMCFGHCSFSSPKHHRCGEWHREYECALKGAEFGYNKGYHDAEEHYMNVIDSQHKLVEESKANEWHYVKDGDLPKDEDWKWCVSYHGYYYVAKYEEMFGCWTNQEYSEVMQPYAWKEIVPPELKENE